MVLILRRRDDPEAARVARRLEQRGTCFLWFDPGAFPATAELSLACSGRGAPAAVLRVDGREYDLAQVTAAWHFHGWTAAGGFGVTVPAAHPEITDARVRTAVERESRLFMEAVWRGLDCFWVPGTAAAMRQASDRAMQLRLAAELGFAIPPTLITNSPRDFLAFYRAHRGNLISKAFERAIVGADTGPDIASAGTVPIAPRDLACAAAVRFMPVVFQAYVPKRLEVRITVVGEQLFAVEIDSQRTNRTRHDWRRFDGGRTPYRRHELPPELQQACRRMVERLELRMGSFDLILTPEGGYVFLEINPGGRYDWIERATGLPITAAVCDLLTSREEPAHAGTIPPTAG